MSREESPLGTPSDRPWTRGVGVGCGNHPGYAVSTTCLSRNRRTRSAPPGRDEPDPEAPHDHENDADDDQNATDPDSPALPPLPRSAAITSPLNRSFFTFGRGRSPYGWSVPVRGSARIARAGEPSSAAPIPRQSDRADPRECGWQHAGGGGSGGSAPARAPVDPERAGGQRHQDADPSRQALVGGPLHRLRQFHRR
jgi:hypothetical protein